MDNVYTYFADLPPKFNEIVVPCADGYTIYIDERLDRSQRIKAYFHALYHIKHNDFDSDLDADSIEKRAHDVGTTDSDR